jgi:SAM-dependent methyltransferase
MKRLGALVMENTLAYRLWQAPFVAEKLAPVLRHTNLASVRRVLDVGCGPGINAPHFQGKDYVGVDWNPGYIDYCRARFKGTFIVADITRHDFGTDRFDLILVNSFLHHVDDASAGRILGQLGPLLTQDGRVHIIELVMPPTRSIPRLLARWDRGDYPRPLADWRRLFESAFRPEVFEPFSLRRLGVRLWDMVYFKGRAR